MSFIMTTLFVTGYFLKIWPKCMFKHWLTSSAIIFYNCRISLLTVLQRYRRDEKNNFTQICVVVCVRMHLARWKIAVAATSWSWHSDRPIHFRPLSTLKMHQLQNRCYQEHHLVWPSPMVSIIFDTLQFLKQRNNGLSPLHWSIYHCNILCSYSRMIWVCWPRKSNSFAAKYDVKHVF